MTCICTTLLALAFVTGTAFADVVELRSGGRLVGIARVDGDKVVIEVPSGTITVSKRDVASIVPGRTLMHVYDAKYAAIRRGKNACEFHELAVWAKAQGLTRYVNPLLERVIELDPDHAAAREALGFVRHEGRWMTVAGQMRAQGCVEFRGRWCPPEERDALLAAEAANRLDRERRARERKRELLAQADRIGYTFGLPAYGRGGRGTTSDQGSIWSLPWFVRASFPAMFGGGVRPHRLGHVRTDAGQHGTGATTGRTGR